MARPFTRRQHVFHGDSATELQKSEVARRNYQIQTKVFSETRLNDSRSPAMPRTTSSVEGGLAQKLPNRPTVNGPSSRRSLIVKSRDTKDVGLRLTRSCGHLTHPRFCPWISAKTAFLTDNVRSAPSFPRDNLFQSSLFPRCFSRILLIPHPPASPIG
jgi:hypothetical protein